MRIHTRLKHELRSAEVPLPPSETARSLDGGSLTSVPSRRPRTPFAFPRNSPSTPGSAPRQVRLASLPRRRSNFRAPKVAARFLALSTILTLSLPLFAEDILHLKQGPPVHGDILQIADDQVKIHVRQGNAMAVRAIPDDAIDFIDFEVPEAEAKALASGDGPALREVWIGKQKLVGRKDSNAGEIALGYAEALLKVDTDPAMTSALELFTSVETEDWNPKRRATARLGRLRTLLAQGNAEAAMAEAKAMAEETEDPSLFLDARHVLATLDFQELEKQIDENPKWEEDDTVRESIRALYDGTVDRALEPYLFYGSEEEPAARGLFLAARAHRLAAREDDARSCAEDILTLYQKTEYAAKAKTFLAEKSDQTNRTNPPEGDKPASPTPKTPASVESPAPKGPNKPAQGNALGPDQPQ